MPSIKYIVWRDGRPRFSPGPSHRWLGFDGKDLRHANGAWFTPDECQAFSEQIAGAIKARHAQARGIGRSTPLAEPRRLTNEAGFVYFLRSGARIKIGFSKNPWGRMTALLTGLSHGIDSVVIVPGSQRDERRMHALLDPYRQRGEWFDLHPKVLEAMHRALTFCKMPSAQDIKIGSDVAQTQTLSCDIFPGAPAKEQSEPDLVV